MTIQTAVPYASMTHMGAEFTVYANDFEDAKVDSLLQLAEGLRERNRTELAAKATAKAMYILSTITLLDAEADDEPAAPSFTFVAAADPSVEDSVWVLDQDKSWSVQDASAYGAGFSVGQTGGEGKDFWLIDHGCFPTLEAAKAECVRLATA